MMGVVTREDELRVVALAIREFLWEEFPLVAHYATKEDFGKAAEKVVSKLGELRNAGSSD